jgi:hypothetical protein
MHPQPDVFRSDVLVVEPTGFLVGQLYYLSNSIRQWECGFTANMIQPNRRQFLGNRLSSNKQVNANVPKGNAAARTCVWKGRQNRPSAR